jgi:serine phosphatase RsbU (regulator of sigma subunit)
MNRHSIVTAVRDDCDVSVGLDSSKKRMKMMSSSGATVDLLRELTAELNNFEQIAQHLLPQPGDLPRLHGVDVYGGTLALSGTIGGDHLIYVDFKQRFNLTARIEDAVARGRADVADRLRRRQRMAGIALIDVSGHRITDALLAAMLHQAFLLGVIYELEMYGRITRRLFENLNARLFKSSGAHKSVALIYGEISEDARFRFLSAGQPPPAVFSNEHDRFMEVSPISFPPVGMLPSLGMIDDVTIDSPLGFKDRYALNDWALMGAGDILLLHSDGLAEHRHEDESFFPGYVEQTVRRVKDRSAREIYEAVREDLLAFSAPADDISLVVIKRD